MLQKPTKCCASFLESLRAEYNSLTTFAPMGKATEKTDKYGIASICAYGKDDFPQL